MTTENEIPDPLKPPAGLKLILRAHAEGDQIYVCKAEGAGHSWVLKAPQAELFEHRKSIGKHFGGPTWELDDGSRVVGKLLAKADSPDKNAIPRLLISAVEHAGKGRLSTVTHIQRINTTGGKAPDKCGAADEGKEVRAAYTADYFFYGR